MTKKITEQLVEEGKSMGPTGEQGPGPCPIGNTVENLVDVEVSLNKDLHLAAATSSLVKYDIRPSLWAQFATGALASLDGYNVPAKVSTSCQLADQLLIEWERRFGNE